MGRDYAGDTGRVRREGPSFTASGGRVLAVDDNRENLLVLRSLLRRTLLTVDTVTSGSECLEAVRRKNYHVIFMDYMMNSMDGIETFRRLREENKNFMVPVITLTADARQEMKQRFLEEGRVQRLPYQTGDVAGPRTVPPRIASGGPRYQMEA
jgi:CheY-like chemotaxis protein